jgi:hypothetical protein
VKLDLDPLWNASEKLFIHVKPVDPTLREIAIPVTRQCDEIVCYSSTNGVTLFDYEEGWAQQRMREVQAMMKELQGKLEWLSMVEGEKHETRIQRQLILNTRALYSRGRRGARTSGHASPPAAAQARASPARRTAFWISGAISTVIWVKLVLWCLS